ncbi:hypothetical protein [Actinomadura sp. 7K507]|uniref:hypothetical protein n=1 Tax=Actinomadura sp. 7K507 TaxID=2530365 RepID=UPI00104A2867|nr:hypothetical protein [Actinomadura sp. 7K507]TDC75567.1 hypothetical protein E1285_41035 [Actinomadura sp. 7K507]
MNFRRFGLCALAGGLVLGPAGCGESGDETKQAATSSAAPATSPAGPATGEPAGGGQKLGGKEVSLTLPSGWKQVDPLTDDSEVVRTSFSLTGEMGPVIEKLLDEQKKQGVVFAIDTSVKSGYAPHAQAGCDRGGLTGASLEQLKRKQVALEPNSKLTDVKVGGKPGFKATYSSQKRDVEVEGVTVRVPVSGDRFCFVDIEAKKGTMPPQAEQLAASFALA